MPQAHSTKSSWPHAKACGEKDDEFIEIGAGRPLPVAPQGDVQIVRNQELREMCHRRQNSLMDLEA